MFQIFRSAHLGRLLLRKDALPVVEKSHGVLEATARTSIDPGALFTFHQPNLAFVFFDAEGAIGVNQSGTRSWIEEYSPSTKSLIDTLTAQNPMPAPKDRTHSAFGLPLDREFNSYARHFSAQLSELYFAEMSQRDSFDVPLSATSIITKTFKLQPLVYSAIAADTFGEFSMDELAGVLTALSFGSHTVVHLAKKFAKCTSLTHLKTKDEHGRIIKESPIFVREIMRDRFARLFNPHMINRSHLPGYQSDVLVFDLPLLEALKEDGPKYARLAVASFASNIFHWMPGAKREDFLQSFSAATGRVAGVVDMKRQREKLHVVFLSSTLEYEDAIKEQRMPRLAKPVVAALEQIYQVPLKESLLSLYANDVARLPQTPTARIEGPRLGDVE
jgi:hypothetical protein